MDKKQCVNCKKIKNRNQFHKRVVSEDGYQYFCKKCIKSYNKRNAQRISKYQKEYRKKNPERLLFNQAKTRAKRAKIPFTISLKDVGKVPSHCPILGIELKMSSKKACPNSPSLDRRIPELGYIPKNIDIISWRANKIKNDASLKELKAIVSWMETK